MGVALGVVLVVVGLFILIRLFMRRIVPFFVFYPEPLRPHESHPRFWGFPDATEVRIPTEDGPLLHGWWFPALGSGSSSGSAIYFHGNAGHLGDRGTLAAALSGLGLDVLLFDYRGFGLSEGKASEPGLYADALAVYRWLVDDRGVDARRLFIIGNSLGSAVAADLATRRDVAGVVLLGAFTHTPALARRRLRWLPAWYLDWAETRFDALERVPKIHAPLLVAAGADDRVIPTEEARRVYEAAGEPKRWVLVQGAGHNDIFSHEEMWRELSRFTHEVLVGDLEPNGGPRIRRGDA